MSAHMLVVSDSFVRSQEKFLRTPPEGVIINKVSRYWEFPNGAKLWFGWVSDIEDVNRYMGCEFVGIHFDGHFSPRTRRILRSRIR